MPDPTWILYNHKIQNFFTKSGNYFQHFEQTLFIHIISILAVKMMNFEAKIPDFPDFDMKYDNFCSKKGLKRIKTE